MSTTLNEPYRFRMSVNILYAKQSAATELLFFCDFPLNDCHLDVSQVNNSDSDET